MDQTLIDTLKQNFSGNIILPSDDIYKDVQNVFLATGKPAIVLQPKNAQDVVLAIHFAKDTGLPLAVRSGGHSGAGFGTNNDGVVIDVSLINSVEVIDKEKNIVKIGSGAKWVDVANTLQASGLALSSGDTKTVGVGGLTLGGGIGWLVRKVGLTIDNLLSAEVVTADGRILTASTTENTDLFWAIRGGGGNFGIVTYFEFKAEAIGKVFAGPISYGIEDVESVLKGWRDTMRTAPEELNSMIVIFPSMGGNPAAVMVLSCFVGNDEAVAMKAIEPLKNLGKVTMQAVTQKDYAQVLEEAHPPQGVHVVANNMFVKTFSDELIATLVEMCKTAPPIVQIRALGGAMNRIPADATAFAHRDTEILLVSPAFIPLDATEEITENAMKPWKTLSVFGLGSYANLLSTNTTNDLNAMYPESTLGRLRAIKKIYDPENVFQSNYNIQPGVV